MEDEEIIGLFWNREEQAITETKGKYGRLVSHLLGGLLGNAEDAAECENDTYLGLWNAIPENRPQYFCAFLCKIARNQGLKRLEYEHAGRRKCEHMLALEELAECVSGHSQGPEAVVEGQELRRCLSTFLYTLPETERDVFLRRYWFDDSIQDICLRFGFGESKVKSMLLRTRKKLKKELIRKGFETE